MTPNQSVERTAASGRPLTSDVRVHGKLGRFAAYLVRLRICDCHVCHCDRPWPEPHVFASRRARLARPPICISVCAWPAVLDVSIRRPGRETTGKALCVNLAAYLSTCFVGCGVCGCLFNRLVFGQGGDEPAN